MRSSGANKRPRGASKWPEIWWMAYCPVEDWLVCRNRSAPASTSLAAEVGATSGVRNSAEEPACHHLDPVKSFEQALAEGPPNHPGNRLPHQPRLAPHSVPHAEGLTHARGSAVNMPMPSVALGLSRK
jgi:hypothetical protein